MARVRGIKQIDRNTNSVSDQLISVESGTLDTLLVTDGTQLRFVKEGTGALAYFESNKLLWTSSAGLTHVVGTNSVDGSDDRTLLLSASDSAAGNRSAFITLSGNEASVNPSSIFLVSGNSTNSLISLNSSGSAGRIDLHTSNILRLTLTAAGSLQYNNSLAIHASSIDGADNQRIVINGGGSNGGIDPSRGAGLQLSGNEETNPGLAQIFSGDVAGSLIQLVTPGTYPIRFWTNSTQRWEINGSGNLVPSSDVSYNIGSTTLGVNNVYTSNVGSGNSGLNLFSNNTVRWQVNLAGNFIPAATTTYDIGSDTARVNRIYASAELRVNAITKADAAGVMSFTSGTGAIPHIRLQGTTGNKISASTSDASDNTYLKLGGGGDTLSSRGALLELYGNETTGSEGQVLLRGGENASGTITLQTTNASAGITLELGGNSSVISLQGNTSGAKWQYNGTNGELQFTGTTTGFIGTTTSDGSDNASLFISSGGGGAGTNSTLYNRGGSITLRGNEQANAGQVLVQGGAVAAGHVILRSYHASSTIQFQTNALLRWSVNGSGQIVQDATNGSDIVFNRAQGRIVQTTNLQELIVGDSTLGSYLSLAPNGTSPIALLASGTSSGGSVIIRAAHSTAPINFQSGGSTTRWQIQSTGHLVPFAGSTYDIGTTSLRVRNLYVDNIIGGSGGGSLSTLANETFLNARNFGNSADVGLIKLDANDDTIISSDTGDLIKLTNIAGSDFLATFDYVDQSFTVAAISGTSRIIQTSATIDSRWSLDPTNSRAVLGTISSHDLYFNTANLNRWYIDLAGRLAEDATNGGGILLQNATSGIEYDNVAGDLYFGTLQARDIRFYTGNINRWRILSSGNIEQDATDGGFLDFTRTNVGIRGPASGVLSLNLGASGSFNVKQSGGSDTWVFNSSGELVQGSVGSDIVIGSGTQTARIGSKSFGYSAGYKALFIGDADTTYGNTVSLWLNVDLSANTSGSFSGHGFEYFLRNTSVIGTPNAANNGYHYYWGFSDGDVTFNKTGTFVVRAPTSDGADDRSIAIASGGAASTSRGGYIAMHGNEIGGYGGSITLIPGNVATADLIGYLPHASTEFQIRDLSENLLLGFTQTSNLYFGMNDAVIRNNTTDGADTRSIEINAGGATDNGSGNRGAFIKLYGNEHATLPGRLDIQSTVGNIFVLARGGLLSFGTNTTQRWEIDSTKLNPTANNTYDIGTSSTRVKKIYAVDLDITGVTSGVGQNWTVVTGTSATMAADNGYIANNAALVTLTLPATCAVGKIVEVAGLGAGGFRIAQNAGQVIHFGATDTTTGVSGSVSSTNRRDTVKLLCVVADTEFTLLSSVGTLDVV